MFLMKILNLPFSKSFLSRKQLKFYCKKFISNSHFSSRKVFKKKKGTFDHLVLEESKRFSDGSDSSISEDGNEGEDSSELSETMSMKDLISPQPPLGQIDQQDESFKNVFVCESKSRFPPIDKPATPVTSVSKHQTKPSSKLELPSISSPTESEEFDKPHLDFDTTANLSHKSCDDLLSMEGIPSLSLELLRTS